ncbi:MAG: hypothetical protein ACO1SX_05350 [Actinomycetota bacterium]
MGLVGMLVGAMAFSAAGASPEVPASSTPINIRATGEALGGVLPRLAEAANLRVKAAGGLKSQRVTLFTRDLPGGEVCAALTELLSASDEQRVYWRRSGNGWQLTADASRARLVEELQRQDLQWQSASLEKEIAWTRSVPQAEPLALADNHRAAIGEVLNALGKDGRDRLLAGEPAVTPIGSTSGTLRTRLRTLVRESLSRNAGEEVLDRYSLVLIGARDSTNALGNTVVLSIVKPNGGVVARVSLLRDPRAGLPVFAQGGFRLPPPDPTDTSPRVTFKLTGEAPASGTLRLDLDQVLERLADGSAYNVIGDGYLRPAIDVPPRLELKDYPIRQFMNAMAATWRVQWRIQKGKEHTLLVRARDWWLEDRADVPQNQLERLRTVLPADRPASLKGLLEVAELNRPQVHKLLETGLLPAAHGVASPLWHDETGAKPALQFFSRLSEGQQKSALSKEGLVLGTASKALVNRWLSATLFALVGATDPESWGRLTLRIAPGAPPNAAGIGFEIRISEPEPSSARWVGYVAPMNFKWSQPRTVFPTTNRAPDTAYK